MYDSISSGIFSLFSSLTPLINGTSPLSFNIPHLSNDDGSDDCDDDDNAFINKIAV